MLDFFMAKESPRYSYKGQWEREKVIPRRKVVVTGIGMITPSGIDTESSWSNILAGNSSITTLDQDQMYRIAELAEIDHLKDLKLNIRVAGLIDPDFDPAEYILNFRIPNYDQRADLKRMPRTQLLSLAASAQTLQNAGILTDGIIAESIDKDRFGTKIGTSVGGMSYIALLDQKMTQGKRISPTAPLKLGMERVSAVPSQAFKLRGSKFTPTDACATGSQAIISGLSDIVMGFSDRVLVGGVDAPVEQMTLGMFDNMKTLNRTDNPHRASIPFDKNRQGFVMSEGVGMLLLEAEDKALERGAKIIAEIAGIGSAADAHHDTEPSGYAAEQSLREALERGGIPSDGLLYVNAHGTSTEVGDPREILAIRNVLEKEIPQLLEHNIPFAVSSTKSILGHTMGASGAIEAAIAALALRDQILPPTINLQNVMEEGIGVDLVPNEARPARISRSGSKNFGFGGSGTHILFKHYEG